MGRRKQYSDESEEDDDESSIEGEKIEVRKPKIERLDKFKNLKKIIINISMTQYPVIGEVADEFGWKVQYSNDAGDWDIFWTDFSIDPDVLIKMHLFQKINHYPGIHTIARKNLLGQNLSAMSRKYPEEYNFFPMTWLLPQQYSEFRAYYDTKQKGKTRTYIVKPEAECQGRGIFLTRKLESIETGKHYVVQRYMARPYLIDGLKFDLRIYVLLAGTSPLRLYMYHEGLARFATELYHEPMNANLDKLCMHLTNYAINKHNKNFVFNTSANNMGIGHKRSLTAVFKQMADKGLDVQLLKEKIKDIIIKTIISGLPLMSHQYKFSQPEDYSGNMCFHILGLDVMINNKADPFVVEVNHTPSFTTDTPLDHKIKYNLIKDTLALMNINTKKKNQLYNRCKQYNEDRLLTGKRHIYEGVEREQKIKQAQRERDKYEEKHLGGYEKIFPLADPEQNIKYEEMIGSAMQIYMEGNTAVKNRYQEKEMRRLMRSDIRAQKNKKTEKKEVSLENKSMPPQSNHEADVVCPEGEIVPQSSPQIPIQKSKLNKEKEKGKDKEKDKGKEKGMGMGMGKLGGVNEIRTTTTDAKNLESFGIEKSSRKKLQNQIKIDKHRAFSKNDNHPLSALNKFHKAEINKKQLPSLSNTGMTEVKKTPNFQRVNLKSEPKPPRLLQNIDKDIRQFQDRKTPNGGYVMPKIFCLNMETEKSNFNLLSLGKKVQSAHYMADDG